MRHKEDIFDLYNSQNEAKKEPEPERVPEEVRPEDMAPDPEKKQETPPEPSQDPEPEKKEGGNSDGV